jgi:hypothetical protein
MCQLKKNQKMVKILDLFSNKDLSLLENFNSEQLD